MLDSPGTVDVERLIDLRGSIESPVRRALYRLVELPVEKALAVAEVNKVYSMSVSLYEETGSYFSAGLAALDVEYEVSEADLQKIPTGGPLVVVANHPFGAVEGLVIGDLLTRVRADTRILGNQLLQEIPQMRPWVIPVDVLGGASAASANVAALRASLRWLQAGGVLATFPAGSVSHLQVRAARVADPPWSRHVAALARRAGATVVPIFFEGRNSNLFQVAGLLHPRLRTALLASEMLRRRRTKLPVRVGRPLPPDKLARYADDGTLIDYLRFKTYALERRGSPVRPRFRPRAAAAAAAAVASAPAEIIPPVSVSILKAEMARLPPSARLVEAGDLEVMIAEAVQIPALLREIGRLREVTFRAASEGTGTACDLDKFDERYLHLFMWNRAKDEIVGSYRLGRVDEILARGGAGDLYTSSLFEFRAGFLERLGPALELGRSFIRAEYQRKPMSLALLWRGIGEYLVRHPHYKILFGPVSISRDYQRLSRGLMVEFLQEGKQGGKPSRGADRKDDALASQVRAKNPPRERLERDERRALATLVKDADDVSALVAEIEEDNKGIPVLLRHYLRLNARILSFNVDPGFGHCLDGLILVDLRSTEPKILKRFMGEEGLAFYSSVS
jgi:putative hemolysin